MPGTYDPNCETTAEEQVVACRWECLRRNKAFGAVAARWLESEEFRRAHVSSPDYHDLEHHTPRCALDWMLTAAQRVSLANFQKEKLHWFRDSRFNFGPIICSSNFSQADVRSENVRAFPQIEPMPNAPPPITVGHSWKCAPDLFKQQFRLACGLYEFGTMSADLQKLGENLRFAASLLAAGATHEETRTIAQNLATFRNTLRDLAEFYMVFRIPKRRMSEQKFKSFLDQIHASFKAADLLIPTKTFDLHQSYMGTKEDWRWFLEAECLEAKNPKSAGFYQLAEIYSESLRQDKMRGKALPQTKTSGFTGSKFSSKVLKARRRALKRHVLAIEEWIFKVYPRQRAKPATTAS